VGAHSAKPCAAPPGKNGHGKTRHLGGGAAGSRALQPEPLGDYYRRPFKATEPPLQSAVSQRDREWSAFFQRSATGIAHWIWATRPTTSALPALVFDDQITSPVSGWWISLVKVAKVGTGG